MLPGLNSRVLHEYICKNMHINSKCGKRITNDKLYDHLPHYPLVDLIYDMTCEA